MIKGRVSICIPSRNEKHLQRTIDGLLANAAGDIEIFAVLDGGPWPDPPLTDDKRVIVIRHNESIGMRPVTNAVAQIASGEYFMKCDAHCMFAEGFDEVLKANCDGDWVAVPMRHSIDGAAWTMKPRNWGYHILTYPYLQSMYGEGLHAVTFGWDQNKIINAQREHIRTDDLLSFQGSLWFMTLDHFHKRVGPLDHENFYFYQESQSVGLKTFLRGGRCVLVKDTWYAHMHKGKDEGRGYYLSLKRKRESEKYATDFFVNNKVPGQTRTFDSLIEQFWPLISEMKDPRYAWPDDWRDFEKHRRAFESRTPDQIPAHI